MTRHWDVRGHLLAIPGAAVGGGLGGWVFEWILAQGYYAMMLPGFLVGVGGGAFLRYRSWLSAAVCGLFALLTGVILEWRSAPFLADDSLGYFLTHLRYLKPVTLGMIGLGGLFGFWSGRGWRARERPVSPTRFDRLP